MNKNDNTTNSLNITALGGLHETGKNMWLVQSIKAKKDPETIILDAGVHYPGNDAPGIDYTMADNSMVKGEIKALVLTSVHEYHSGGAHHVINKRNIKQVIGSKLALETVKLKLSEDQVAKIEWNEFASREQIQVGSFTLIPFRITSGSAESYALVIESHGSKIFYTGTYKIDQSPSDGFKTDMAGISTYCTACLEAGRPIDLLLSDSALAEKEGYSASEMALAKSLKQLIASKNARVLINTCSSNTVRIQNLFIIAEQLGKKVALLNKEARETYTAAVNAGYLKHKEETLISIKEIDNQKDSELLIISTAPEGDALKELERVGYDKSLEIQIREGDVIINSADLPPGTVRVMAQISDQFFLKKAEIIGGRNANVNIDNHALTEEMKFLFNLIRPKHFVPAMGESRLLVQHAKLAVDSGVDPGSIFILDNGDQIKIHDGRLEVTEHINTDQVLYTDSQDFHLDTKLLKERDALAKEGVVTLSFAINKKNKVVSGPSFSARACTFSNNKEWRAFCLMNSPDIVHEIEQLSEDLPNPTIEDFQNTAREFLNRIIKTQIGKKPSVIVLASQI
ncbi:MAG: ribonuclease J [Cyanobacteria bacterium]|nr:ribonuclease J [Cyanobacteriota bacterium]MDA1020803.1 ribonuclease J [Cyanobacteriota bacterium]